MSVYKKLHQLQSSTRSLSANADGQTGQAHYGYVSGSKLLGIIRPQMDKLGLILTQEVIGITNTPTSYMTKNGEKTEMFTCLHIRFTWTDAEDGSQIVNEFYANGMNAWDKGLGSALTYAERYYLMKTFHIATDEDDVDALVKDEAINDATPKKDVRKVAAQPQAQPQGPASEKPISNELYWALVKGKAEGRPTKNGEDIRAYFIKAYGPNPEFVDKFDHDVKNVQLALNPQ